MTKTTFRPNRQINLDTLSSFRLIEIIIPLTVGACAYLLFSLSIEHADGIFKDENAKKVLSDRLFWIPILFFVVTLISYLFLCLFRFSPCKTAPITLISSSELKKRWENLAEDEIGLILLASTPSIFKYNSKRKLLKVGRAYCFGDVAAKLRKILKDDTYHFDNSEIQSIETHSRLLRNLSSKLNCPNFVVENNHPKPKKQTDKATQVKKAKKLEAVKSWSLHTTQLLLQMIDTPTPKRRYSEEKFLDLVESYCNEDTILLDGNNFGLSKTFIMKIWFKSLPAEFRIPKSTEQ